MNAHTYPVPGKPRRLTARYKFELRQRAEVAIDRLIRLIDEIDGDPDLEPYLSQSSSHSHAEDQERTWWFAAQEGDNADGEDNGDNEAFEQRAFSIDQSTTW